MELRIRRFERKHKEVKATLEWKKIVPVVKGKVEKVTRKPHPQH